MMSDRINRPRLNDVLSYQGSGHSHNSEIICQRDVKGGLGSRHDGILSAEEGIRGDGVSLCTRAGEVRNTKEGRLSHRHNF